MTRHRPDVVASDVDETLLDLGPVAAALVGLGRPDHLLPVVFGRTLLTGFAATVTGGGAGSAVPSTPRSRR